MSQVQGFGCLNRSTKKRSVLSSLFRNLGFRRTNRRYRFFDSGKTKEHSRFAPFSQAGLFKGEDITCVDVQELTEGIKR